jgi:hypothetical protein
MDDANEVARVRKSNKGLLFFDYQSQTVRNRRANSRMAFPVSLAGLRCRRCGLRHHGLRLCDRVGLAGEKRLIPVHLRPAAPEPFQGQRISERRRKAPDSIVLD